MSAIAPLFRIDSAGNLAPTEGTAGNNEDVFQSLKHLPEHPLVSARGDTPCIAIAECDQFAIELPEMDTKITLEARRLFLTIFWAFDERFGENALIAFDNWNPSENPKSVWAIVPADEWATMPIFGQLLRRFATAEEARRKIVQGQKFGMILEEDHYAEGSIVDVHGPSALKSGSFLRLTDNQLAERLGIAANQRVLSLAAILRRNRRKPITLKQMFPNLDDSWYAEALKGWNAPVVLYISFTPNWRSKIVARTTNKDKCFVRFLVVRLGQDETKTLFAPE